MTLPWWKSTTANKFVSTSVNKWVPLLVALYPKYIVVYHPGNLIFYHDKIARLFESKVPNRSVSREAPENFFTHKKVIREFDEIFIA